MRMKAAATAMLLATTALMPNAAMAQTCSYGSGRVYTLKSLTPKGIDAEIVDPVNMAEGYIVNVTVNGGDLHSVMIDTGSNVLIVPFFKVGGLGLDGSRVASNPLVISDLLSYGYGSSGISYKGYLVNVPVVVNTVPAFSASPRPPLTNPMSVFAITETCGKDKVCEPIAADSTIGMMGIGFQATPELVTKDNKPVTNTNVFAEVPNLPAVGYILGPNGITVGLDAASTAGITWSPLHKGPKGNSTASGCMQFTPPGGKPTPLMCGSMLLDTGVSKLFAWIEKDQASICPPSPAGSGGATAGFGGVPFKPGTKVRFVSPAPAGAGATPAPGALDYTVGIGGSEPGTPNPALCIATSGAHSFSNIGRMPLQRYTYARNETCQAYGYRPN